MNKKLIRFITKLVGLAIKGGDALERYREKVPSRHQMAKHESQKNHALELAQQSASVHFREMKTVMDVTDTVNVGTFPRLVKPIVSGVDDKDKTEGVS